MEIYSEQYDFEKNFQHIIDILQAKIVPTAKEDITLVQAIEYQKHAMMTYFDPNVNAPGALFGLGKEPDYPNDSVKEELRSYGKAHRKNGLHADHLFILGEERMFGGQFLYITGARRSKLLNTRPHIETYKMELTRQKKGTIDTIGELIKVQKPLAHHIMFIDGYYDLDKIGVTALDKLMYFRGNK